MSTQGSAPSTDGHLLRAFEGLHAPPELLGEIAAGEVVGVTLFRASNVASLAQVSELVAELQAARPAGAPPLIVAIDQEGGQFLGLGPETTPFAGNLALGAAGDPDLAEEVGAAIGAEAAAVGINVVYAPVCDLATELANPSLGLRSFGDDPVAAGALAAAFVRGLERSGVASTLKHLPGLGAVTVDSHHELGVVPVDAATLHDRELAVFRTALAAGPRLVMSAHVAVPALTGRVDLPASLSREVMTGLLRDELAFTGVAITDALDMHALQQDPAGQVLDAVAALRAGVDLLLAAPDPLAMARVRDGLRSALRRGLLDPAALEVSADRIDALRRSLPAPGARPSGGEAAAHRALAETLAARAVTLVRDVDGLLPLSRGDRVVVVEPQPRNLTPADTSVEVRPTLGVALRDRLGGASPSPEGVAADLAGSGEPEAAPGGVEVVVHPDPPSVADVATVLGHVRTADRVVLGTSAAAIDPAQRALVRAVLDRGVPTVVVVQRSAADLAAVEDVGTVLLSYGFHRPSSDAVAAVLTGAAVAPGQLPVQRPR